jgi:hypothetical protein
VQVPKLQGRQPPYQAWASHETFILSAIYTGPHASGPPGRSMTARAATWHTPTGLRGSLSAGLLFALRQALHCLFSGLALHLDQDRLLEFPPAQLLLPLICTLQAVLERQLACIQRPVLSAGPETTRQVSTWWGPPPGGLVVGPSPVGLGPPARQAQHIQAAPVRGPLAYWHGEFGRPLCHVVHDH